jgi:hypothetical protein
MNSPLKLLADAHADEFRREAERPALQAAAGDAARDSVPPLPRTVTIRVDALDDAPALKRLAAFGFVRDPSRAGPARRGRG